jgi:protein-S-isoprenylcysteine O-methyltransferase Ste14
LITHGPFRLISHPMYSGLALSLLGCVFSPFLWW